MAARVNGMGLESGGSGLDGQHLQGQFALRRTDMAPHGIAVNARLLQKAEKIFVIFQHFLV